MGHLRAILLIMTAWALGCEPASAFGTVGFAGQHHEHQRITRLALRSFGLAPRTLDALAGTDKTFGAVGGPDNPLHGLVFTKAAHCDSGDYLAVEGYPRSAQTAQSQLEACRTWIFDHLQAAITAVDGLDQTGQGATANACGTQGLAAAPAKCKVLQELGMALHAAQDFYAHSNWVDRVPPGRDPVHNPPGLGHEGAAAWLDPAAPGTPFPAGLMTGCWDGIPTVFFCGTLSKHPRVSHDTLNKDTGLIDLGTGRVSQGETPRGSENHNFERAVDAAILDSRGKWTVFEVSVTARYGRIRGGRLLCLLKSDTPAQCR